jgi:hypothetical protein
MQPLALVRVAVAVGTAVIAGACSTITDAAHVHQGCTVGYTTAWQTYINSEIAHSDARSCPAGLNPGSTPTSSAVIYDNTAPNYGSGSASSISLDVTPNQYSMYDQTCSFVLAYTQTSYFYWGQARPGHYLYDWQVNPSATWTVVQTPEYLCFRVFSYATVDPIRAVITINYWGTQW